MESQFLNLEPYGQLPSSPSELSHWQLIRLVGAVRTQQGRTFQHKIFFFVGDFLDLV